MSEIIAIPARLESTRLPGKVLVDIHGHPMLWYVYQAVAQAKTIAEIWILTDSQQVFETARSWGAQVLMTSADCPSGTARIASAIKELKADIVVNVQGDEPLIVGDVVDSLVEELKSSNADVATPVYRLKNLEELNSPNVVKVVRGLDRRALYFSRSPVPHVRDQEPTAWFSVASFWGHAGVYAYRREVLLEYAGLPIGTLEEAEKLEQLRLLEAGKDFLTVDIDYHPESVDTPEDLERVKQIIGRTRPAIRQQNKG